MLACIFVGCAPEIKPRNVKLGSYADSVSYAIGFLYGLDVAKVPFNYNLRVLHQGIVNALYSDIEILSDEQIIDLLERFYDLHRGRALIRNQEEGRAFMEINSRRSDVITTESGLQYRVIKAGNGRRVRSDDNVTVHYTGRFINGEVFDSSYNRNEPTTFNINRVIDGWREGLVLMSIGDVFEFVIPDSLAYSLEGFGIIEPGMYLIYEVEVLNILMHTD